MSRNTPPVEEYDAYDEYNNQSGADVGYYAAPTQRFAAPSTSSRRYTVERPVTANPTTTLRKASQGDQTTRSRKTIDYNPQNEMGDDEVLYGSKNAHRRTTGSRPSRTDEDPRITTNVRRVNTSAPQEKGVSRRGLIVGGVSLLLTGIVGGNAAVNMIHDWQLRWAQGPYPVNPVKLVCGHGDSAGNPTLLYVFIEGHTIVSVETPGGNHGKDHVLTGIGLPTTGDISRWELQVIPIKVGVTQWQIEINVIGVDGTGKSFNYRWLLVDNGHGYFVGVK